MLSEVLGQGFALAHRRIRLIFLDILWKALWLALTAASLLAIALWFGSELRSIQWEETGSREADALLSAVLLKQFWNAHQAWFFAAVAGALALSIVVWLLLEAFFRQRIVTAQFAAAGVRSRLTSDENAVSIFLASGVARFLILGAAAFAIGLITFSPYLTTPRAEWPVLWPGTLGASIAGTVALLALAFLLTVFETALRSDAIHLLGVDLIRVSGLIGILVLFETVTGLSLLIMIVAGFLSVARVAEALTMAAVAIAAGIIFSLLHSYLLLVRFSAVGILKRNVVDV